MFITNVILLLAALASLKVSAFKGSFCSRSIYNSNNYNKRIINGENAKPCEFPWMVSVRMYNYPKLQHHCGGAIINEYTVVSAAHCFEGITSSRISFRVVVGDHSISQEDETEKYYNVSKILLHPRYNKDTVQNDIAILKLEKPIDLNSLCYSPVCLPAKRQKFQGDCIVTGWGVTKDGRLSDILQKVTVPIVSDKICRQSYGKDFYEREMLCAGYPQGEKDSCQGDSGGPLVCFGRNGKLHLAGIVSWGLRCAAPGYYGVYTEVSNYFDWISKLM